MLFKLSMIEIICYCN